MNVLSFLQRNSLWISVVVCGLGVFLLWFCILTVVRLGDKKKICTLPLTADQEVEFAEAGRVDLWLEGPHLTSRFARLTYELTASDGTSLEGRGDVFRTHSSSFSRARVVGRIFTIPHPGRYVLHVKGLGASQPRDEDHNLIFMRPYFSQVVACILGMLAGAFIMIGGILIFVLGHANRGGS